MSALHVGNPLHTDAMGKAYRNALQRVQWENVPGDVAEVLFRMTVVACRACRGTCWCGTHFTPVDGAEPLESGE